MAGQDFDFCVSRRLFLAGSASAALMAGISPRLALASDRPALPIPAEMRADPAGTIKLSAQASTMNFLPGVATPTYGINGPYLGPALRVRRGDTVNMDVRNTLAEPVTMHWHGLEIPGDDDGGPAEAIAPGATWKPSLTIDQPAATCWFHPHYYPSTAELVLKGLAGLFIIEDDDTDRLPLPSTWGVDDIPIIIQDRRFNPDGSFFHRFNLAAVTVGYVGDTVLVNGAINPVASTAKGWLRLRLLNGSNARSYQLAFSDDRPFYVIASDGGLLAQPVRMNSLPLHAGERYEILVDARDGSAFDLVTSPVMQMAMNLPPFDQTLPVMTFSPDGAETEGTMPDALATLPPLSSSQDLQTQDLKFGMNLDAEGMGLFMKAGLPKMRAGGSTDPEIAKAVEQVILEGPDLTQEAQLSANNINGVSFALNKVNFDLPIDTDLRMVFSEGTDKMLHPVHVHGCQYRVVTVNGDPAPEYMQGWKDTAAISQGGTVEVQVRFKHPATAEKPYMAHCHILEHEDSGMMAAFTVS
ncbi:blue copper oxidase [Roseibium hamelinense]|uniref:Multicopper oxidase CueO n=1 Tax=Roseibium hamelinense TaxID=150831 RepID=A0A562TGG3_9HYPH|nr:multicopper oxidase CueO [Roseibium hamelinense]TWI92669.1 blue copper oxidase [Roseibium hamelinense]